MIQPKDLFLAGVLLAQVVLSVGADAVNGEGLTMRYRNEVKNGYDKGGNRSLRGTKPNRATVRGGRKSQGNGERNGRSDRRDNRNSNGAGRWGHAYDDPYMAGPHYYK